MVLPHRRGVALKAFADEHFFSGASGNRALGALRLRRRSQEQAAEKKIARTFLPEKGHWHRLHCLQATLSGPRGSVNRGSLRGVGLACPTRHRARAGSDAKRASGAPGA